jgi:hypothetical protein
VSSRWVPGGLWTPVGRERLDQLLTAMGERLELQAVPLDAERPASDVRDDRARSMTARLEDGFALASFASQLAGSAQG